MLKATRSSLRIQNELQTKKAKPFCNNVEQIDRSDLLNETFDFVETVRTSYDMCHSRLLDNETYQIKERLRAFAPRCKISSRIEGHMSRKFYDCRYRSTFVRLPWYLHAQPWNWKQVHGYARDKARGMKRRVSVCPLGGFSRRNARCWCKTSDIS